MRRIVCLILGLIFLVLGTIGTVLPILPTVPFYLLVAFFLSRGSSRIERWLTSRSIYRLKVAPLREGRGMKLRDKAVSFGCVTVLLGVGFAFMGRVSWARGILVAVWLFHIWLFWAKTPTAAEDGLVPEGPEAE